MYIYFKSGRVMGSHIEPYLELCIKLIPLTLIQWSVSKGGGRVGWMGCR